MLSASPCTACRAAESGHRGGRLPPRLRCCASSPQSVPPARLGPLLLARQQGLQLRCTAPAPPPAVRSSGGSARGGVAFPGPVQILQGRSACGPGAERAAVTPSAAVPAETAPIPSVSRPRQGDDQLAAQAEFGPGRRRAGSASAKPSATAPSRDGTG